jgi:hypothetical protein
MTFDNAERQRRFRQRREYLRSVRPADVLLRNVTAHAIATHRGDFTTADAVAAETWPQFGEVQTLTRAASSPTTMASAGDLVQNAVGDFLANIGPASAGAQLLSSGMQLKFDNYGGITAPAWLPSSSDAGFLSEGQPIPVRQMVFGGVTLTPSRLKTIQVYNSEVFEHATPNVETIISTSVAESVGLKIDSVMFGTAAANGTQPMGLRYQVSETAHEATATGTEAMNIDVTNLASTIAPVAGNGPIILVAAPKQAISLRLRKNPDFPFEILSSAALSAGTVMAVAANAVVSVVDPAPKIETSTETVLNFDDSNPQNVSTNGTLAQGSTRSVWQTSAVAVKLTLGVAWGLRCDNAVAWTSGVVW